LSSYLLGLSSGYHDSAAALLKDGEVIAAAQEERFSRLKQDSRFPANAVKYCLAEAGILPTDLEAIFYYENPVKKLGRLASTYLNFGWKGYGSFVSEMPAWLTRKVHVKRALRAEFDALFQSRLPLPPIEYVDHHRSHAAAAFFPSPYRSAAVLCIDGVGEWATTSAWIGSDTTLAPVWDIRFPHSIGLLYSAITYFCGFKVDSGEYKLMGLAPYGEPVFYRQIVDKLIDVKADGSFWLNMDYFDYAVGDCMVTDRFEKLFGGPRRKPETRITKREFDLAASIQAVLEDVILRLATTLRCQTGERQLCMAGGVALNCVANGKLLASGIFDDIWIQPAAGDSGGALGAALAGWYAGRPSARREPDIDAMKATLLGSSYTNTEIEAALRADNAVYTCLEDSKLCGEVADLLADGNVVGWFQGRMEFGPRALGARSILGDPRNPTMQSVMNLKIKNRESFRPFAPAVLEEHAAKWFKLDRASPYMLFVVDVQDEHRKPIPDKERQLFGIERLQCVRSSVPAVTHVDYSARVQTVGKSSNPRFRELLEKFYKKTDCPVLVNTSFNVRGEPIVESPQNAYLCFMRTQMDYLVIGDFILRKGDQPPLIEARDWREQFALD
jgi:carbamoyltransferase